ncbi:MAG: hypothetical protein PHG85_00950 [Candidatus Altiarchaeota archaeon]|nr:hypothetical protein [Candidatus Altiarchaeota archaeon]
MLNELLYVFYGMVGGPAVALSFGLKQFSALYCFVLLSISYILSVVVISLLLSRIGLERMFRGRIFEKFSAMVKKRGGELAVQIDDVAGRFNKELGDLGFYLALMSFTFMFGVYWAAVIAVVLRLNLWRAITSMSVGAVLSVGFWIWILRGRDIDPQMVTLMFFAITVFFVIYGSVKENKTLSRMTEMLTLELGKLEKFI